MNSYSDFFNICTAEKCIDESNRSNSKSEDQIGKRQ
jgi:hypothetical protein